MEEKIKKKGNGSSGKTGRKIPGKLKEPNKPNSNPVVDRQYLSFLSLLTIRPFHHLLSAQRIYSSIINNAADAAHVKIPTVFQPSKRLQMFQTAAADQHFPGAGAVRFDRFLEFKVSDTDFKGRETEIDWSVFFQDELQGCAEIYRAEMLLFKRLICEQKEDLANPLILTNEKFGDFIDYELFDRLTNNKTDELFIKSLSAAFRVSITLFDEESAEEDEEVSETVLTDRIHGFRSYNADTDEFGKIKDDKLFSNDSPTSDIIDDESFDKNTEVDNSEASYEKFEDDTKKETQNTLRVFELNMGAYWRKWRQAAQLAKFDFDLLEKLGDPQAIRFYELSKMLRLSSYDQTTRTLPTELEIEYERFAMLMPLPKFQTEKEIKNQIQELIQPLITNGYVGKFSYSEKSNNERISGVLQFEFND